MITRWVRIMPWRRVARELCVIIGSFKQEPQRVIPILMC